MTRLATWVINRDSQLFYYINRSCRGNALNRLMPWVTELGGPIFTIFSSLIFYVLGREPLNKAAFDAMMALVFSHVAAHFVKRFITRPRPYLVLPGAYTVEFPLKDPSFPSGHTTAAFSLAIAYSLHFPILTAPLVLLAVVTGFSRVYLGLHYPSDVVMGALFGTIAAILSFSI